MSSSRKRAGLSRRHLIGGASVAAATALGGASAAAASAAPAATAAAATTPDGWRRIRRIVTSEDASGRGVLLADGEPGNSIVLNGTRITRLWEAPGLPAQLPLTGDAGATAGNAYRPDFVGTSFYIAELPGGERAPSIPMHSNSTLDYMAILSGSIVLQIEGREFELGPGDVIVQGGNMHTFENRGAESCLLLFVVVTGAKPARGGPGAG
jgi:mannose-6-phosphate isomerase-like protein (cupin superfamily)